MLLSWIRNRVMYSVHGRVSRAATLLAIYKSHMFPTEARSLIIEELERLSQTHTMKAHICRVRCEEITASLSEPEDVERG